MGAEGQEEADEAVAVETMAGGGWDENVQLVVALGCMSQNLLHVMVTLHLAKYSMQVKILGPQFTEYL